MADNIDVKDAAAATKTLRTKELSAGLHLPFHALMDSTGAEMLGEKVKASSVPVVLPSDMPLLGRSIVNIAGTFQRPATTPTYASGQLVANSATAGSVVPLSFLNAARFSAAGGRIVQARLFKTSTGLTNASFRLHIYGSSPTPSNGDTGVWLTDTSGYLGHYDITLIHAFTDGSWGIADTIHDIFFSGAGSTLRGLLEARAAYEGVASESFTATLEIVQA